MYPLHQTLVISRPPLGGVEHLCGTEGVSGQQVLLVGTLAHRRHSHPPFTHTERGEQGPGGLGEAAAPWAAAHWRPTRGGLGGSQGLEDEHLRPAVGLETTLLTSLTRCPWLQLCLVSNYQSSVRFSYVYNSQHGEWSSFSLNVT